MQRSPAEPYPEPMSAIYRLVHIRIRHDDHVVFRSSEALRSLPGAGCARVDAPRDRGRPNERNRANVVIRAKRLHGLPVAVDHIEDSRRETGFDHQLRQAYWHRRIAF